MFRTHPEKDSDLKSLVGSLLTKVPLSTSNLKVTPHKSVYIHFGKNRTLLWSSPRYTTTQCPIPDTGFKSITIIFSKVLQI